MEDSFSKYSIKRAGGFASSKYKFFDGDGKLLFKSKSNMWTGTTKITSQETGDVFYLKRRSALASTFELADGDFVIATMKPKSWTNAYNLELHAKDCDPITLKSNAWASKFRVMLGNEEVGVLSSKDWTSTELGIVLKNVRVTAVVLFAFMITLNIMRMANM